MLTADIADTLPAVRKLRSPACDHRAKQEEKGSEGGTVGVRRPAPTVLSRIRQQPSRKNRPRSESAYDRRPPWRKRPCLWMRS